MRKYSTTPRWWATWFLRRSRSPGGGGCESVLKPLADLTPD
jgi:hypothetical protein